MADMRDIAREARVSMSTVSHVLNGTRFVSPELRQRVLEAAERLGYRHNALARSLRTKRSHTLALVIPDITNPYYPEIARGVLQVADAAGYVTVLCSSDRNPAKEVAILRALESRRVDGIIFNPSGFYPDQVSVLKSLRIPLVLLGSRVNDPAFDLVLTNPRGAYEPVSYLIALGHRRIGFIGGLHEISPRPRKYTGYVEALRDAGLPVNDDLITQGNYSQEAGYENARRLLSLLKPPTAIFAANDLMAIGAMVAVREAALAIPEDVSVIGFDDIPQASITTPRLTTVVVPKYEMGRTAAELLLRRIENPSAPFESVVLPHTLIVRESSGPYISTRDDGVPLAREGETSIER